MDWTCKYKYWYLGLMLSIKTVMNSPTRIRNYDVDEFCDKLLKSDRFEKLIEKVAEKAVGKISVANHNYESSERANHDNETKEKATKSNRAEKTTWPHLVVSQETEQPKQEPSKGNKMSNLGSYSIAPLSDLSLQFKKFTKKASTIKASKPKEPRETTPKSKESREIIISKESKESEISEKESKERADIKRQYSDEDYYRPEKKNGKKNNYKANKKQSIENNNKEAYKEDVSSGEFKSESDESIEMKSKTPEKEMEQKRAVIHKHANSTKIKANKRDDDYNRDDDRTYSKENTVSKSNENHKAKVTAKIEEPYVRYDKKDESQEKRHDTKQKEKYSHEELKTERKDKEEINHSGDVSRKTDKLVERSRDEYAEEKENHSKVQTPVLRTENGKLYTYQLSSEYEDYHEQLIKMKKGKRRM